MIDVAEDLGDGFEVARDGDDGRVVDLVLRGDRHANDADQIVVGAQRHDHEIRGAIDGDVVTAGERALQHIGGNAGKKLAGVARSGIVAEAGDIALEPRIVQEQRAARDAEEIEDGARDSLRNCFRLDHRHQLVNLREVSDFLLEHGRVHHRVGEIVGGSERVGRIGEERLSIDAKITLTTRLIE